MARMACVVAATATAFRVFLRLEVLDLDPGESIYLSAPAPLIPLFSGGRIFFFGALTFAFYIISKPGFARPGLALIHS